MLLAVVVRAVCMILVGGHGEIVGNWRVRTFPVPRSHISSLNVHGSA